MSRTSDPDDRRVSEAYQAIADERPPQHLDRAVLRMAAKAGRTPYAAARAWMRPAAWAAVIGLSLALVMELALLPQDSVTYDAQPADVAMTGGNQPDTAQPAEGPTVGEDAAMSVKAPLTGAWRARGLPAKATAAPDMLQDTSRDKVALEPQYLCPPEVRDSAERWYDCLASLRETTPPDRIAEELEILLATYPGFVAPSVHK